jgi:acyl phosphate:glycerol-3-phosphate acyltransferase
VWIEFLVLLIGAFLLGSIPVAYLVVKFRWGKDIRQYGSRQVGGSNLFHSFSKPLGVAVGVLDAGKGVFLVWFAHHLGLSLAMQISIGIAVVLGHNWPIFLRFNAGRGLATTVGIGLYFLPWSIIPFAAIAVFTLVVGSSPLPLLIAVAAFPVSSYLWHKPLELTLGLLALWVIMIVRRLTAPLNERSGLVNHRQLLLNRFLFDRDIRDGKAWIFSKPEDPKSTGELTKKKGMAKKL